MLMETPMMVTGKPVKNMERESGQMLMDQKRIEPMNLVNKRVKRS